MQDITPNKIVEKVIDAVLPKKEKWALVLEGGAMRSIFTAGVLDALQVHHSNTFDIVIGTSAGAACGAGFVAQQRRRMQNIFMNYLSGRRFLDFLRLFDGEKSVLDLNFAIRKIGEELVPLDLETLVNSKTKTYVTLTNIDKGEAEYLQLDRKNTFDALVATCNIPLLTPEPVVLNGLHYVDGGVADPIPLQAAVNLGATKVITVLTRPNGERQKSRKMVTAILKKLNPKFNHLQHFIEHEHAIYNRCKNFVENFNHPDVEQIIIAPPSDFRVDMLTRTPKILHEGYAQGFIAGLQLEAELKNRGLPKTPESLPEKANEFIQNFPKSLASSGKKNTFNGISFDTL